MEKNEKMGNVVIANEVLMVLAGLAATDVAGVRCLAGGVAHEAVPTSSAKTLQKSVRVSLNENTVSVKLALVLTSEVSIPAVSRAVQEKVSDTIESMAGLQVDAVDITITGVEL